MIKKVEKGVRDFMKQYKVTLTSEIDGLNDSHALRRLLTATIIGELVGKKKVVRKKRTRKKVVEAVAK